MGDEILLTKVIEAINEWNMSNGNNLDCSYIVKQVFVEHTREMLENMEDDIYG